MMKTVSVIIPFYSHIDWLYEAIESVLAQSYPIHEIILVNDGSKEDMTEFLKKYGDKIQYIYQENAGPATARNNGIKRATGDYIAFEDSDDIWLPTKIEKQIAFMEETSAKWSHVGFYYWWPETGKQVLVDSSRDYDDIFLQRHISTKIATPAVILDRSIYEEGEFVFPIERFHLRVQNYNNWKADGEQLTLMIHVIYGFYTFYTKLFGKKSNIVKDFFAKCCWTIPYALERVYVRYLFKHTSKDENFIRRYNIMSNNCKS